MGIFVTALLLCISLPGKKFACKIPQFSVHMNAQDSFVYHIILFLTVPSKEFDLCTRGACPEIKSLNEH